MDRLNKFKDRISKSNLEKSNGMNDEVYENNDWNNNEKLNDKNDDLTKKYENLYHDIQSNKENINYNLKMFEKVKKTNLFDAKYYVESYVPSISEKYALIHYLNEGYTLGFNPNKYFDNDAYIEKFDDVKRMGMNPLVHYILCQDKNILQNDDLILEFKYQMILKDIKNNNISHYNDNLRFYNRIKDTELFDKEYYIKNYKLPISEEFAIIHFLNEGFDLGFNPSNEFDCEVYLKNYPDVKNAGLNPFAHYISYGEKEGRLFPFSENVNLDFKYQMILKDIKNNNISHYNDNLRFYNRIKDTELFDKEYYIKNYKLPISEEFAIIHFLNEGFDLGFNPSNEFDCEVYLKNYPDIKNAGLNPFAHYISYGEKEGRLFPFSENIQLKHRIDDLESEIQVNRVLHNVSLLRDKVSKKNIVNVVFILPAMMFAYEKLYELFKKDSIFNVKIVLVPHRIGNRGISDVAKEKYYHIFGLLKARNFDVIDGYDFETDEGIDLESVCNPHIIFYILPYMRVYPENMRVENLSPNLLYAYITYGEYFGIVDDNSFNFGWNEKVWKIFANKIFAQNAMTKSIVGSSNVVPVGSPRMDSLVNYVPSKYDYSWIFPKEENKKRIIWAPHHTLSRPNMADEFTFSTFDKNFNFFYEYAKNNPDIEWVFRPHPLLKEVLSEINTYMKIDGIANEEFIDDYFFKWESLPNARVHEEIDYFDLFANADAMITDCLSFTVEYLFADKPGLILTNNVSSLDNEVYDAWYKTEGDNFDEINRFIDEVVIGEDDYLKNRRNEIFSKFFDLNYGEASKVIYNYIRNQLI